MSTSRKASKEDSLRLGRMLMAVMHLSLEAAVTNPAIPEEYRDFVRKEMDEEGNITLEPARLLVDGQSSDWFRNADRSSWYYWSELRSYLLTNGFNLQSVQSLDQTTDRILERLFPPTSDEFDVRGLVLGYVQSGKTSNYTATIAKAADCGFRLFIVLSGIDKGLRKQTQMRLERELMGVGMNSSDNRHVPFPPVGMQWHSFTTNDIDGDFSPGTANQASLQGTEPVIMVIKKNSAVIRRLLNWLDGAQQDVLRTIPTLVVDDEADLASIDTRGTYQTEDEPVSSDYEPPSVINGLVRELLTKFRKKAYIAYTATPFANVLIPHDTYDPRVKNDLYPKDFIVDLPKPTGYFGAEELFGMMEPGEEEALPGLGILRQVDDQDLYLLEGGGVSVNMEKAMLGFVLSGAAMVLRGFSNYPSTMLIHTSPRIERHTNMFAIVQSKFSEFKDSWRYDRVSILDTFKDLWETDFRTTVQDIYPEHDVEFDKLIPYIGPFLEAVQIRIINSFTGAVLDYEREPNLKAIGIGGNKLSRGLTLEGLTSSFFVRNSPAYDTLMQMGRWFGFRQGYEDLTRIWTTKELSDRFALLSYVEHRLRQDIRVYADMQITPYQLGMRIWQHPTMQVTSYMKRRFASNVAISSSYSEQLEQTFKFPFDNPQSLAAQQDANVVLLENLLTSMGKAAWDANRPTWIDVNGNLIFKFLSNFCQEDSPERSGCSLRLISKYIENQQNLGELVRWTVSIRGRESSDKNLGETVWKVEGKPISQISRTKRYGTLSLGVLTSPGDEKIGLSNESLRKYQEIRESKTELGEAYAIRRARPPEEGLLLIYPISRRSKPEERFEKTREPLYTNDSDPDARDLIGIAISFPYSSQPHPVQAYLEGTVRWRPYDEEP